MNDNLKGNKMNKSKTNLSFLLEETPISYYWMGFIMADGSFSNKDYNEMAIVVNRLDENHLKKLSNKLNCKCKLSDKFNTARLSCYNKEICPRIMNKFDIFPRKTYNPPTFLPSTNKELLFCYLAGLIDGDGSIPKQTGRQKHYITINCHASWQNYYSLIDYELFEGNNALTIDSRKLLKYSIYKQTNLIKLCNEVTKFNLPLLQRKWDNIFNEFNIKANYQL
jgi:hypothetical protein